MKRLLGRFIDSSCLFSADGEIQRWSSLSILLLSRSMALATQLLEKEKDNRPAGDKLSKTAEGLIARLMNRFPFRASVTLRNPKKNAEAVVPSSLESLSLTSLQSSALVDGVDWTSLSGVDEYSVVERTNVLACYIALTLAPLCKEDRKHIYDCPFLSFFLLYYH